MGVPSFPDLLVLALVGFVAWAVYRATNPPVRRGTLLAVDSSSFGGSSVSRSPHLLSPRYGLSGRPDEIRRGPRGTSIPVEIKSSQGPDREGAVWESHRVQLLVYCLLLEESTGAAPPYGLLIYRDGRTRTVPWDARAREEVLGWLARFRLPYQGQASPGASKCPRCAYWTSCDVAER